jgi:hypothetical protein
VRGHLHVVAVAERRGGPVGVELIHLHPQRAHIICAERGVREMRGHTGHVHLSTLPFPETAFLLPHVKSSHLELSPAPRQTLGC